MLHALAQHRGADPDLRGRGLETLSAWALRGGGGVLQQREERFLGKGRTEHGRVEEKDAALHSSGALTSQARHSQNREESHTDALIKFPSLL